MNTVGYAIEGEPNLQDLILLYKTIPNRQSFIALKYTKEYYPLVICPSNAGYYIGAWDDVKGPIARDSKQYYRTEVEARYALDRFIWTQRLRA